MAKKFEALTPRHIEFIKAQKIFFVATAAEDGLINLSPKGLDSLRVLDDNRVIWLNLTGSGNETAAHLKKVNRMTIMFCAFDGKPSILRLYGTVNVYHRRDAEWNNYIELFPPQLGARQLMEVNIDMVQTSCGYAVPLMEFKEDRTVLDDWAAHKGEEGIKEYWKEKNTASLDGFPTDIL